MDTGIKITPESRESDVNGKHIQIVPQEQSLANDYDIDGFLEKRKQFITKVNAIMVKGSDYHEIQGRKSLAKGGAEKIASIFGWTAEFRKDMDVAESFAEIKGLIGFVCDLAKNGNNVGQGRGAATLEKNGKDPNKTIKMAQKSAFIDAVLRASGLSDFFTQDLEDMPVGSVISNSAPNKAKPLGDDSHTGFFCSVHDNTIILRPAGVTKQGKKYSAFYACSEKENSGFCKAPILNKDGEVVNPNQKKFEEPIIQIDGDYPQ